ncbi:MAG TPA: hypothetical protein VE866_14495, partial [Candidatus Binatia bacterium]|nr:hypothetical protein [Candidatus Binatia bacterium]
VFDTKYSSPAYLPAKNGYESTKSVRCSVPDGQDVPGEKNSPGWDLASVSRFGEYSPNIYGAKTRAFSSIY